MVANENKKTLEISTIFAYLRFHGFQSGILIVPLGLKFFTGFSLLFSHSKTYDANIGIITNFVQL